MKHISFLLLSAIIVTACGEQTPATKKTLSIEPVKKPVEFRQSPNSNQEEKQSVKAIVEVKNSNDYSKNFIRELRSSTNFKKFKLIDSLLVIDYLDTVTFPSVIKIGQERMFTGRKDNLAIALRIKRINYTSINYDLEMVEFGKSKHLQKGTVELSPGFFLGSESLEDKNGNLFYVDEYSETQQSNCLFQLRIGYDNNNQLMVKIAKNCNGKIRSLTFDHFPFLLEK